jgi:membrane protease YdiL (CAAX protease family)
MSPLEIAALCGLSCVVLFSLLGWVPYRDEFRWGWRRFVALLLWFGVLVSIVFLPVAHGVEGGHLDPQLLWFPQLFEGHVVIACFLFAWWRLRGDITLATLLSLSASGLGRKVKDGIVAGITGWMITILVTGTVAGGLAEASTELDGTQIPEIIVWLATLPLSHRLCIIVAAMTFEEAFFRAFLQPRIGLVASSILFALGHFSYGLPYLVVGVFTISLVLGRTFTRHGDLIPCIVAHGVFDGIQLLVVLPCAVHFWAT